MMNRRFGMKLIPDGETLRRDSWEKLSLKDQIKVKESIFKL